MNLGKAKTQHLQRTVNGAVSKLPLANKVTVGSHPRRYDGLKPVPRPPVTVTDSAVLSPAPTAIDFIHPSRAPPLERKDTPAKKEIAQVAQVAQVEKKKPFVLEAVEKEVLAKFLPTGEKDPLTVKFSGFPKDLTKAELLRVAGQFGVVTDYKVPVYRAGCTGIAYVKYEDELDVLELLAKSHLVVWEKNISVRLPFVFFCFDSRIKRRARGKAF
jgi:hypothetical protein